MDIFDKNKATTDFINEKLKDKDPEISNILKEELARQQNQIELIASENIVSNAVLEAQGSVLTNKYAEGYPAKRYYGGCYVVDKAEKLAIERATELFNCNFANVQPHSGSQANQAVFNALVNPGDTILGMSLAAGGHLTHGASPNQSGKWFNAVQYGVRESDHLLDYDEMEALAVKHKPKLIIAGWSAYSRKIDFSKFREVADKVGANLMIDMAHFAGLVAAGIYDNPLLYADVVTTTTHKTLRGPRGGMILTNNETIAKQIDKAIFPGIQGGPLMHIIAAKAVAFKEALSPEFKQYAKNVVINASVMAETLKERGVDIVTGGTDNHLVLVDLRPKKLTGKLVEESLENASIACNKNSIPYDTEKPFITSGIRIGSAAATTRGFSINEFKMTSNFIGDILDGLVQNPHDNSKLEQIIREKVTELCKKFPIYS